MQCCGCGLSSEQEPSVAHRANGLVCCNDCQRTALAPSSPAIASGGTKADAGKLGTHLLPTRPLEAVARVLDFGAKKYAPDNWRKGIAYTRVYGAVLRHLWAWWRGESTDVESGQPHLACAMCELAFLLEYELSPDTERRGRCDDRPEANAGPDVTT